MSQEKISELIKELKETETQANIVVEEMEPTFRPAWTIKKNHAIQKLPSLRTAYVNAVKDRIVYIFAVGNEENTIKFAEICRKDASAPSIEGNKFLTEAATTLHRTIGPNYNQFGIAQNIHLTQLINEKEAQLGLTPTYFEGVSADSIRIVKSYEDVYKIVQEFVFTKLPPTFTQAVVATLSFDACVDSGFDKEYFPVVVTGLNEQEAERTKALFKNNFVVNLNSEETIDKNLVFGILKKIKSTLTSTKKVNKEE